MRILIDIGHPAHIHYSRNSIAEWQKRGHEVLIIARDKKVIIDLLNHYKLPFVNRGKGKNSALGKFFYMLYADLKILRESRKFKPDIFLSFSSSYAAQVAYFLRKPHIAFNDTEHTDGLHSIFTYPFSSCIITPESYQNDLGLKHVRFKNIDDGLYLHKNYFEPDIEIKKELGIKENEEYIILRFVSWNAHHDYGQSGLNLETKRKLISLLEKKYRVFISSEEELDHEFRKYQIEISPYRMHDALSFASLFVGESGTMASESAFNGTYAVYINSLPLMCYLKIEQEANLVRHFKNSEGVVDFVKELISNNNLKEEGLENSAKMKENMIDPTKFLVWFIESYPKSFEIMKKNPNYQEKFL